MGVYLHDEAKRLVSAHLKANPHVQASVKEQSIAVVRVERLLRWHLLTPTERESADPPIFFESTVVGTVAMALGGLGVCGLILFCLIGGPEDAVVGWLIWLTFVVMGVVNVVEQYRKPVG